MNIKYVMIWATYVMVSEVGEWLWPDVIKVNFDGTMGAGLMIVLLALGDIMKELKK